MMIKLLPSEIARLVLNYLEEEKYSKTYEAFLNESRYLEECKIYIKQGVNLPKTIHGKKLTDFLVLEREEKSKIINKTTQFTQTDGIIENNNFNENVPVDDYIPSNDNDIINNDQMITDDNDLSNTQNVNKPDKGISCLTELIESNDLNVEITTDTSSINVSEIKIIKSPEIKLFKYPSLIKSPEKKIRLDIKPDIIQLSSDESDSGEIIPDHPGKKRKLLIGKNVQKIPELSVSTLERQLNSIISDATNHIKQQEDQEKIQQQQQSFNIINTINKGPPLLDFQMNYQNIQPQAPSIIQQTAATNICQFQSLPIQQFQSVQSIQNMSQFQQNQTMQNSMPQKVFIIANSNSLNTMNFAPKQDQFIQIPQLSVNSINCINSVLNNNNNDRKSFEKPIDILENTLKSFDSNSGTKSKENNIFIKPKPSVISSQPIELKRKSTDKDKLELPAEKKKKPYVRNTPTIKSIFEKSCNTITPTTTITTPIPVITISPNSNSNCSNDTFSINSVDTQNNNLEISNEIQISERKSDDEKANDAILDMLGLNLPMKLEENKKDSKNQSDVTDFDLDDLVKKSTNLNDVSIFNTEKSKSPVIIQKKAQKIKTKRKSSIQSAPVEKSNEDLNLTLGEITSNEDNIRQLRSRTNSQRKMV